MKDKISDLIEIREHMGNVYATCAARLVGERAPLDRWAMASSMVRNYIIHQYY